MESSDAAKYGSFYMIDKPSEQRCEGWPLDSISLNKSALTYFTDEGNSKYDTQDGEIISGESGDRLINFLVSALGL